MISEHVQVAEKIRQVFIERIDDHRKICSLEVNVLDLKTFEILLMDRQAIVGVDEAERLAAGDEEAVRDLLTDLCRTVHTPLYDRRKVLIRTRQHLYAILEEAGLLTLIRREFLEVYEQRFVEEERSDDRSRMLEVALEVDWLKSRIAEQLALTRSEGDGSGPAQEGENLVTVDISGKSITVDIPEPGSVPTPELASGGPPEQEASAASSPSEAEQEASRDEARATASEERPSTK